MMVGGSTGINLEGSVSGLIEVLFLNLPHGRSEELQSGYHVYQPKFEPSISSIEVQNFTGIQTCSRHITDF
jgi:hypothetical protein